MNRLEDPTTLLRLSIRANAAFSVASGIVLTLGAAPLAHLTGVPSPWILGGIGLSLIGFALGLYRNSRRRQMNLNEAKVAVALDFLWVAGSAPLLALGILTPVGNGLVIGIGAVVLTLAVCQLLGLQRVAILDHLRSFASEAS